VTPSALIAQYLFVAVVGKAAAVPQLHTAPVLSVTPLDLVASQTGFGRTNPLTPSALIAQYLFVSVVGKAAAVPQLQ